MSLGAADAKGFCVCVYNVCLYRQVIYVCVKGLVKRRASCCRKHRTGLCVAETKAALSLESLSFE